jgi:membrane protease YdiL (CAAX protease family)
VTGLFFGLIHVDLFRIVPTGLLGVLLSWVALASGSIVPAMLIHLVNNASVAILAQVTSPDALEHLGKPEQVGLFALALLVLCLGVVLVRGSGRPPAPPRRPGSL